jgi:hypothetical protein
MPSPFPGMDPWLEAPDLFPGLHERLTIAIADALNATMPPGYVATTKHIVWVDPELRREPDVALYGRDYPPGSEGGTATLPGMVALGRKRKSDPIEEPYLEILSDRGKRLVTAVEVISVTNKRAGKEGRESYQQKQEEYALGGVNLVEIDLLRRGPHVGAVPLSRLRRLGAFDYHASVLLAGNSPTYHAAGFMLADRLPAIGIPLDKGMPPVLIDLQPMLDDAYAKAKWTELFSYADTPDPPLTPEQQAWADALLRAKGVLPPA